MSHTFSAVIHKEEDLYVAQCPEVGTVSQGKTVEEAVANLKETTELYLEEFPRRTKGGLHGSSRFWLYTKSLRKHRYSY